MNNKVSVLTNLNNTQNLPFTPTTVVNYLRATLPAVLDGFATDYDYDSILADDDKFVITLAAGTTLPAVNSYIGLGRFVQNNKIVSVVQDTTQPGEWIVTMTDVSNITLGELVTLSGFTDESFNQVFTAVNSNVQAKQFSLYNPNATLPMTLTGLEVASYAWDVFSGNQQVLSVNTSNNSITISNPLGTFTTSTFDAKIWGRVNIFFAMDLTRAKQMFLARTQAANNTNVPTNTNMMLFVIFGESTNITPNKKMEGQITQVEGASNVTVALRRINILFMSSLQNDNNGETLLNFCTDDTMNGLLGCIFWAMTALSVSLQNKSGYVPTWQSDSLVPSATDKSMLTYQYEYTFPSWINTFVGGYNQTKSSAIQGTEIEMNAKIQV